MYLSCLATDRAIIQEATAQYIDVHLWTQVQGYVGGLSCPCLM